MREGRHDDTYLILFEEQAEAVMMTERYGLFDLLPGFMVVGLRGWDDWIVRDGGGHFYTVPTVPIAREHMEQFDLDVDLANFEADEQMHGKIKWNVTPLIFGGKPNACRTFSPLPDWFTDLKFTNRAWRL